MSVPAAFTNLVSGFLNNVRTNPLRPALEVAGCELSYGELWDRAGRVTRVLNDAGAGPLVAVLARRELAAYGSVLGILASGRGYVPLNPKFPVARLVAMLEASRCRTLLVSAECEALASEICEKVTCVQRVCFDAPDLPAAGSPDEPESRLDDVAYLLFTSGSTGVPKGVPITHASVTSYVSDALKRYQFRPDDRFSQMFDLTFDLSVHDMFVCWTAGATLCVVPESKLMLPAKFIRERALTVWFSVPSVAWMLRRANLLAPGSFPSLRWSLFCGEPLTEIIAASWQSAAPNSVVENLYGPTEATIAIKRYRWNDRASPGECVNGIVPIGHCFEGHESAVMGDDLDVVPDGGIGELWLSGPQVARGYWHDPVKTAAAFTSHPDRAGTWYHTGDIVRRTSAGFVYLGRKDHQVKIGGHRVELQEIEGALRRAASSEIALAVPWPLEDPNPSGIVAVLGGADAVDQASILAECRKTLPTYMIPREIVHLNTLPLNANGKVDRGAVLDILKKRTRIDDG